MKKSISLRKQLVALMVLLVFLQSLALVCSLLISRTFYFLDAEAFRLFNSTSESRASEYNLTVGKLIDNLQVRTTELSRDLTSLSDDLDLTVQQLYQEDQAYNQLAFRGTETLLKLLEDNNISGAFLMINGSNADKDNRQAHSAVYIRNSAVTGLQHYLLETGPIAVSQQFGIAASIGWDLDIKLDDPEAGYAYYTQPIWAGNQYPNSEIERYGYWSPLIDILGDGKEVVSYTMPMLDRSGQPYGVLGVELSRPFLERYYLPNRELPFENSFYAISPLKDEVMELDWFISSSPLSQVYLSLSSNLQLEQTSRGNLRETNLEGLGELYCSAQPLRMYSNNSPFYEESWSLISFVPKNILHGTSSGVRSIVVTSLLITTGLSIVAILLLVYFTTRKISGLSKYAHSLSPYMDMKFAKTGIQEIDELTAAVEMLNKSVIKASKTTSKILELSLLPIGGFEISQDNADVVLTGYVYELLGLSPAQKVSREEWALIYEGLIANSAPNYEDVYGYDNGAGLKWLRIKVANTEDSQVGVILDVSHDIKENQRLSHELDLDNLTRLYNRTAFKRKAHKKISKEPDKIGAMIFTDLDNLKYINDNFGHDVGDRLIMRTGDMLRTFEKYGAVVSRISGDEFSVYLHGYENKNELRDLIYRQFEENQSYMIETPDGSSQKVRSSSGIAFYPSDSDDGADLMKLADFAMYEAKHNCKGSTFEFNKQSYQDKYYLFENREAINRLLDEELIRFAFQPIVDLGTGKIYAYEALMRPCLDNFKTPLEILNVAGAQSKLCQVEQLVLFTAFDTISKHQEELQQTKIFINSIPNQTLSEEDSWFLVTQYADLFKNVVIEIIESEDDYPEYLASKLAFIRRHGMGLALDDFGNGFSNEMRILSLKPDLIKIDMELVSNIDSDLAKQQLVANLVSFCKPKGILLVAEGVERSEELAQIARLGVDLAQGFYIGLPNFEFLPLSSEIEEEIVALRAKIF